MFTKRRSLQAPVPGERTWFTDTAVPARACCCPARPAVKVIMPPAPGRDHPVDLWLCGHHYRVSSGALGAVGAITEDIMFVTAPAPQDDVPVQAYPSP